MNSRILSAIMMVPLILFIIVGKIPLLIFALVVSIMALFEFFKAFERANIKPYFPVAVALTVTLYALMWAAFFTKAGSEFYFRFIGLWFFAVLMAAFALILTQPGHEYVEGLVTAFGCIYISFCMSHFVLLDRLGENRKFIWLALIIITATDVFAYYGGTFFGAHPLSSISPQKTLEGAGIGLLASCIFSLIFGLIFAKDSVMQCLLMGLIGSVAAQAGDLTASVFKRKVNLKDYGNLIPGHGGVMDRIDGFMIVLPVVYYYTMIFVNKGI